MITNTLIETLYEGTANQEKIPLDFMLPESAYAHPLLTDKDMMRCVVMHLPAIMQVVRGDGRDGIHLVVANPAAYADGHRTLEKLMLFAVSINGSVWRAKGKKYDDYAPGKLLVAAKTGKDTLAVQQEMPAVFGSDDVVYAGGILYGGYWPIAVSGALSIHDIMICYWIGSVLEAITRLALQEVLKDGRPTIARR